MGLPGIESDSSDSELLKADVVEDDNLSVSESGSVKYVDITPIFIVLLKLGYSFLFWVKGIEIIFFSVLKS